MCKNTSTSTEIKEPIMVLNPLTGRHVNVAPLFNRMADSNDTIPQVIKQTLRHINLSETDDVTMRLNVNHDLYKLEDMFSAMTEYQPTRSA